MKKLVLILGDQLFETHPDLAQSSDVLMIESTEICTRYNYHKQKLAYLWTCMREYRDKLEQKHTVHYINLEQQKTFEAVFKEYARTYGTLIYSEITDKAFSHFIHTLATAYFHEVKEILDSPMFLTTKQEFVEYLKVKPAKRLLMNDFYIWQRRRLGILADSSGKPIGEKWSFDSENRKKLPKSVTVTPRPTLTESKHFETIKYLVQIYFPNNPGLLEMQYFPSNHTDALKWVEHFFDNYLSDFGAYEDALTDRSEFVFHSVLSPLLNTGLLTPAQVLQSLADYCEYKWHIKIFYTDAKIPENVPLNSIEGFIRQIIGWREWVKGMYDTQYSGDISQYNYFKHTQQLPSYFYNYSEMVELEKTNYPLAKALQKTWNYAYNHHIERLMIISNWMVLNEYNPVECLNWFKEMYIDAYDWVMVPNVIGMGLFADGGIFATKPYIAGGNYIKKMSDYPNSKIWEPLWTEKFWSFLLKHETFFNNNSRLNMLISGYKKRNA